VLQLDAPGRIGISAWAVLLRPAASRLACVKGVCGAEGRTGWGAAGSSLRGECNRDFSTVSPAWSLSRTALSRAGVEQHPLHLGRSQMTRGVPVPDLLAVAAIPVSLSNYTVGKFFVFELFPIAGIR
jgi:hypothetical protein